MTNYIWKAKDKSGKSVVREISANTIESAKAILVSEGHTDLELFQDEIMAATVEGMDRGITVMGEEIEVTAEQRIGVFNKPPLTIWKAIIQGIGQSKGIIAVILALCILLACLGHITAAIVAGCALLAWLLFILGVSMPSIAYTKLQRAMDWHRWTEATNLLALLEVNSRISFIRIPKTELVRTKAMILAGQGRLDAAIAEFQEREGKTGCPSWLHKAHLVGICNNAAAYDKALDYARLAVKENPLPILYLDLANVLARYHRNTAGAREALKEVEQTSLPEFVRAFHVRCIGIIAFLEGNLAEAKESLESALRLMEATSHVPGREGNIRVTKAYLCCVLSKLGDKALAREMYVAAKDYLEATKEEELIKQCQNALN